MNKSAGDNPALAFLTVLGGSPPAHVAVNEMTTVASVWTNAQFLDGATLKGPALSLSIAAGNAPNFVDVSTGGWDSHRKPRPLTRTAILEPKKAGLGPGGLLQRLDLLFHRLESGSEHGSGQLGNVLAIADSGFNPFFDQPLL